MFFKPVWSNFISVLRRCSVNLTVKKRTFFKVNYILAMPKIKKSSDEFSSECLQRQAALL